MICRGHRAEVGIIDWSDCNIGVSNKEIDEVIKPFVLPDKCTNCEYARQTCVMVCENYVLGGMKDEGLYEIEKTCKD